MAPRSELIALDNAGLVEFKPRIGTWASYDAWSQPVLQEMEQSSLDDSSSSFSSWSSSKSSSQRRSRRRIRFARSNGTRECLHRSEYTAEEKQACWFKRADYQAMRAHNTEIIEKMTHQVPLNEVQESIFGLERRTPRENAHAHHRMRSAILAVLDEQDDQWRFDGCLNDEMLAARYSSCTWEAKDRAVSLAYRQSLPVC